MLAQQIHRHHSYDIMRSRPLFLLAPSFRQNLLKEIRQAKHRWHELWHCTNGLRLGSDQQ